MTLHSNPATLKSRIVAFAYDYLIISCYLVLLGTVSFLVIRTFGPNVWEGFFTSAIRADVFAFATTILPVALYFSFMESSPRQASWGKQKKGLIVELVDGRRLSFSRAFGRSVLKLLPWQIAHTCLFHIPGWPLNPQSPPMWVTIGFVVVWVMVGAYALSIAMRANRTSLYDQLLGVRVVNAR